MPNSYRQADGRFVWLHLAIQAALLAAAGWLAIQLMDPQLLPYRRSLTPALLCGVISGLALAYRHDRSSITRLGCLASLWIAVLGVAGWQEWQFLMARGAILAANGEDTRRLRELGRHLVVGYEQPADIRYLVRQGYVGGLFLTRRNSEGKTAAQLRAEIGRFQALRRESGLPPLMIVSDQEGGPVSRLSPPLPQQSPLADLVTPGLGPHELEQRAFAYGVSQGKALASLGVNTNFSPVLDLKPEHPDETLDFHTLISRRAIAPDPQIVSQVGLAYSKGLLSEGVLPTLKHFPGLGSADGDTHHFSAHLRLSPDTLNSRDWVPFRTVLGQTPSLLMLGHVIIDSIDPDTPASLSARLIRQTIRKDWHHDGLLVTDDMTMAAVYNRGLCVSATQALNADMDLLLVSFDWEKIYPVLDCLLKADKSARLASLQTSNERLAHAPWLQAAGH